MSNFWTVVSFTVRNKFRTKSFLVMTLIFAIIITIGANLPYLISLFNNDSVKTASIGYIQSEAGSAAEGTKLAEQLKAYYSQQEQPNVVLVDFADTGTDAGNEQALKQGIIDQKIKGYLTFGDVQANGLPAVTYKSEKLMDESTTRSLQGALQTIRTEMIFKEAGLSEEQKVQLFAPVSIETMQIAAEAGTGSNTDGLSPQQQAVNMGLVSIIVIMLFFVIMVTGQLIATEITSEKGSRVMEILITSVSPLTQMFGKVFGMFLVGLFQLVLYGAVMIINLSLPQNKNAFMNWNIDFNQINPSLIVYAIIYYLAGYFLYAMLYAAIGSIVSRTEDLAQAVMPITILSLAGFYISTFSISNPDTMLVKVASYVPFFSPFVMMLRIGLTNPPVWQVLLSLGILFVSIYIFGWLGAKIYRTGVLMYGKRPTFKELIKAMRAYKV
ncbi:ABC transporter permease [Paenibacillus sp. KS-LC4]|uniref:ABC transporter permease n=1 Tax=Paenibacillus sp. KS-LC4 TaxID=2979727 RepID=UPI0030D0A4C0